MEISDFILFYFFLGGGGKGAAAPPDLLSQTNQVFEWICIL